MNTLYFLQWSNRCCARIKSAKCSFYLLKAFGSLQMICGLILDKAEPAETIIQFWYWIIYQEKFSFVQILWFYQIRSQYHIIIRILWFFEFSLDIVFFFRRFWNIFRTLASLGFPSVSVSAHNGRSNTSAAAELADFRNITTF